MKELSIEQKAAAYDKALGRAKELLEIGLKDTRDKRVVLSFFPELKEDEDEKTRKDIVFYITANHKDDGEKARWLYWLEKQGEQNPEYVRKDAFVEKACEYFRTKKRCVFACIGEDVYHSLLNEEEFEDFKKYLED